MSDTSETTGAGEPADHPTTPSARRKARRLALQALYSWQIAGGEAHEIEAYYRAENDLRKTDVAYFHEALRGVIGAGAALDEHYARFLDRPLREVDPIERAILRMACWELLERIDVPARVVVNEGIELAKDFGATDDSYKYVNGILDRVARHLRARELAPR